MKRVAIDAISPIAPIIVTTKPKFLVSSKKDIELIRIYRYIIYTHTFLCLAIKNYMLIGMK